MKPLFDLKGRVAVVTGALGRLGGVWCETLLSAGCGVFGIDRFGQPESPEFKRLRRKFGRRVEMGHADVRRRQDLLAARERCRKVLGFAEIVVNNAGIDQPPQPVKKSHRFEDIPLDDLRQTFDVNFMGAFQVLQVFGEDLAHKKRGSAINIGSLYSVRAPDPRLYDHIPVKPPFLKPPAYGASKAALINLTQYLAALWGPRGVRVNALSPGGVRASQDPKFVAKYSAKVPMGRMATLEDLRGPLLFLASDASSYVTGVNLMVDGGITAW